MIQTKAYTREDFLFAKEIAAQKGLSWNEYQNHDNFLKTVLNANVPVTIYVLDENKYLYGAEVNNIFVWTTGKIGYKKHLKEKGVEEFIWDQQYREEPMSQAASVRVFKAKGNIYEDKYLILKGGSAYTYNPVTGKKYSLGRVTNSILDYAERKMVEITNPVLRRRLASVIKTKTLKRVKKIAMTTGEIKKIVKEIIEQNRDSWLHDEVEYAFDSWIYTLENRLSVPPERTLKEHIEEWGDFSQYAPHPDNFEWNFFELVWDKLPNEVKRNFEDYYAFYEWVVENNDIYELQTEFYSEAARRVKEKIEDWIEKQGFDFYYRNPDTDQPEIVIIKKESSKPKRGTAYRKAGFNVDLEDEGDFVVTSWEVSEFSPDSVVVEAKGWFKNFGSPVSFTAEATIIFTNPEKVYKYFETEENFSLEKAMNKFGHEFYYGVDDNPDYRIDWSDISLYEDVQKAKEDFENYLGHIPQEVLCDDKKFAEAAMRYLGYEVRIDEKIKELKEYGETDAFTDESFDWDDFAYVASENKCLFEPSAMKVFAEMVNKELEAKAKEVFGVDLEYWEGKNLYVLPNFEEDLSGFTEKEWKEDGIEVRLYYDDEREEDKWVVEYEYTDIVCTSPYECAFVETFRTKKEAYRFIKELLKDIFGEDYKL